MSSTSASGTVADRIFIGPKAQAILEPYMGLPEDGPIFSPAEAMRQRSEQRGVARRTPLNCGNRCGYTERSRASRKRKRAPGEAYNPGSYANAIRYACKKAKIKSWSPNQLRHLAATRIRKQFGLDAAQVILGHSELTVTQVYAEMNREKGIDVAKLVG